MFLTETSKRETMRNAGIAVVVAMTFVAAGTARGRQSTVPNSVCRGEDIVSVRNVDLKTERYRSTDLYRFRAGKLYISSDGREEYFYNDVNQVGPGRFASAHKTIVFDKPGSNSATVIHSDEIETRVLRLRCVTN